MTPPITRLQPVRSPPGPAPETVTRAGVGTVPRRAGAATGPDDAAPDQPGAAMGWADRAARNLLEKRLAALGQGALLLEERWSGRQRRFGDAGATPVKLVVLHPRFYRRLVSGGSVGAAEARIAREWRSDDLVGLVRLMVRNRDVLTGLEGGLARLVAPVRRAVHALRRNSRDGSRRNIAAHYDLGNDFFEEFLDSSLTYSCALFPREDATLEEAQAEKIERLCRKLELAPGMHLLEVGCGWGSLALHAARHHGCRVTATTISAAQHELASQRVREAGLAGRVRILQQDYRDLQGSYDRIVSVEMIEAVGHQYLPTYLATLDRLLAPGGLLALQAITIADQHYAEALREVDFIKRHVFPGSFIPSTTAILDSATAASRLRLLHLEEFGPHYARTLEVWRTNLRRRWEQLRERGYGEDFLRLWEFYLAYCEGGYRERHLGLVQLVLGRPSELVDDPLALTPGPSEVACRCGLARRC